MFRMQTCSVCRLTPLVFLPPSAWHRGLLACSLLSTQPFCQGGRILRVQSSANTLLNLLGQVQVMYKLKAYSQLKQSYASKLLRYVSLKCFRSSLLLAHHTIYCLMAGPLTFRRLYVMFSGNACAAAWQLCFSCLVCVV